MFQFSEVYCKCAENQSKVVNFDEKANKPQYYTDTLTAKTYMIWGRLIRDRFVFFSSKNAISAVKATKWQMAQIVN